MSGQLSEQHLKDQEKKFEEQLLGEKKIEVLGYMYPSVNNLIHDGMNQPGLLQCYRTFHSEDKSEICSIITFGEKMCGHTGILHGGASAAVLDQFFGLMMCVLQYHGFTGEMKVRYNKIILCPSTMLIRGHFVKQEGRKQFFKAEMIDEVGDLCITAECIFIQADIQKVLDRALNKLHD